MRNPRFATRSMGVMDTSPPVPRKDNEGRINKTESTSRSPRMGPGSGARRTATPPGYAPNAGKCRYVWLAPLKPAETSPMPAETNTSHDDKHCRKTLKEYRHSSKASGARPTGPLARPPRHNAATRREERPISKRQPLRVPNGYHRRGSGATIGDNRKGPLITGETPISSQNNKNTNKLTNDKLHLMRPRPR
jgi:hypothetical protein